jgi:hypothetical protein
VTCIEPRVDAQTRTAKIRVEVANPGGRLRLGMDVSMAFTTRGAERVVVMPRAAVQSIGERSMVYLPVKDNEGKFVQRQVRLGQLMGDSYTVLAGLRPGDVVVTEGASSCGPRASECAVWVDSMSLYAKYLLPRLIDLAMRNRAATAERAQFIPVASGVVLEIGAGSALNIPFYGQAVRDSTRWTRRWTCGG